MQGKLALASTIELILAREDPAFFSFVLSLPLVSRENRETRVKKKIKQLTFYRGMYYLYSGGRSWWKAFDHVSTKSSSQWNQNHGS